MKIHAVLFVSLAALALASVSATQQVSTGAASSAQVTEIAVPGKLSRARLWNATDAEGRVTPFYSLSLDGEHFSAARPADYALELRYRRFDPTTETPAVPAELRARDESRLWIVQYWTQAIEDYRALVRGLGGEIELYLPGQANVVTLEPAALAAVRALPFVRSVTPYHPAFKLEESLLAGLIEGRSGPLRVDLLTMRRGGQGPVSRWIEERGGTIEHVSEPTYFMTATLSWGDLPALVARDDVQWADPWGPPGNDMNKARIVHGADYVEATHGVSGQGVRVEVLDVGCDTSHPDIVNFMLHNGNAPADHGTCTSGIIVGSGGGRPGARGAAPDAFLVVGNYTFPYAGGSRYSHTGQLVNPALPYQCVLQSNSWGGSLTTQYNSTSQNMDLILFDFQRISICQSQSNFGDQNSRPEAWAKNVISVGGIVHNDTTSESDDFWGGNASIGPAADGRIKPDVASFYDAILCTDEVGTAGFSPTNYYNSFGGTSAATPITAGHLALIYQMWSMGLFNNPTPGATVFANAPNNTTAKALLINSASQWTFSGAAHDLTRVHQGWGHADLENLSNQAHHMLVVDESDVLTELASTSYLAQVLPGASELKVTMVYRDPPGTTSATIHRINDLDLTVTSPSSVVYHGNFGLSANMLSQPGGSANARDTVENVLLQTPETGTWTVTVTAADVNQDAHVETPAVDVDYALVISGADWLPPAPAHLRGRASPHEAHLEFNDVSNNESGFELERSLDGVNFFPLVTLAADDTQHVDPGLTPGTTYSYRVRAVNALGASAYSNVLAVTASKAALH